MELWIARDDTSELWLYDMEPVESPVKGQFVPDYDNDTHTSIELPECWFPEVTFENSPQKVELKLVEE